MVEKSAKNGVFYEPNKLYCFTINPCDKYQYYGHPDRLRKASNYLYEKLLVGLNPYASYVAYMELSEPRGDVHPTSSGPRVHIHGTFILKSRKMTREFLAFGMFQLLKESKCDFDYITHAGTWAEYITKQDDIMKWKPFTNNDKMIVRRGESDDEEGNDFTDPPNDGSPKESVLLKRPRPFHLERSKQVTRVTTPELFFME